MLKAKIEAVLFLTDKPMRAQALARVVNEDVQRVRQALLELINDYEQRGGGLEIAHDNGYMLQVKDEFASLTNEFMPIEMPIALLRTLSAIAIKQPVAQSDIIKIRGAGAYDHVKELMTRELIVKKDEGRSPILMTSKKFQEYFRLSGDGKMLRTELRRQERTTGPDSKSETSLFPDELQEGLPLDDSIVLSMQEQETLAAVIAQHESSQTRGESEAETVTETGADGVLKAADHFEASDTVAGSLNATSEGGENFKAVEVAAGRETKIEAPGEIAPVEGPIVQGVTDSIAVAKSGKARRFSPPTESDTPEAYKTGKERVNTKKSSGKGKANKGSFNAAPDADITFDATPDADRSDHSFPDHSQSAVSSSERNSEETTF